jgi:hypothetical protein
MGANTKLGDTVMKQTVTVLTDDLDGSPADRTVEFAIDGTSYTIDLSEENAGGLRKALDPYLSVAERVGRTQRVVRQGVTPRTDRQRNQAIREWARSNGHDIAERGRVPADVIEAYEKAAA